MSDPEFPADDWDEQRAARAAYGEYVRSLKRQLDAKNRKRSDKAGERALKVVRLAAEGLTEDQIAQRFDDDGDPINVRTIQRLKERARGGW